MYILKNLLDTASEYAALIAEGNFGAPKDAAPNIMASLDGVDYAVEVSVPITAHRELIDAFTDLVRVKDTLDEDARNGIPKLAAYASLADQFQELVPRFHSTVSSAELRGRQGERLKTIIYLLSMEEALCRLLSGSPPQVLKAVASYRLITTEYPDRPTCWFRLGQACRQMLESVETVDEVNSYGAEGIAAYLQALDLLAKTPVSKELIISRGQRAYLEQNVERLAGFVLWRTVDRRRALRGAVLDDDFITMARAWEIAREGLARGRVQGHEQLLLLNSCSYFLLDALEIGAQLGRGEWSVCTEEVLKDLIDKLADSCTALQIATIPDTHTIFKGYLYLGEAKLAERAAREVIRACSRANLRDASAYDREIEERAFREAWAVVDAGSDTD